MGFLTNLIIPAWGRWLAIGLLAVGLFGYGWLKGHESGIEKLDSYKQQVENERVAQQNNTQRIINQQTLTNQKADDAYKDSLAAVANYYSGRMRLLSATGSHAPMSAIPNPAAKPNGPAADLVPAEQYARLQQICAETTAELVSLQNWARAQGKVK